MDPSNDFLMRRKNNVVNSRSKIIYNNFESEILDNNLIEIGTISDKLDGKILGNSVSATVSVVYNKSGSVKFALEELINKDIRIFKYFYDLEYELHPVFSGRIYEKSDIKESENTIEVTMYGFEKSLEDIEGAKLSDISNTFYEDNLVKSGDLPSWSSLYKGQIDILSVSENTPDGNHVVEYKWIGDDKGRHSNSAWLSFDDGEFVNIDKVGQIVLFDKTNRYSCIVSVTGDSSYDMSGNIQTCAAAFKKNNIDEKYLSDTEKEYRDIIESDSKTEFVTIGSQICWWGKGKSLTEILDSINENTEFEVDDKSYELTNQLIESKEVINGNIVPVWSVIGGIDTEINDFTLKKMFHEGNSHFFIFGSDNKLYTLKYTDGRYVKIEKVDINLAVFDDEKQNIIKKIIPTEVLGGYYYFYVCYSASDIEIKSHKTAYWSEPDEDGVRTLMLGDYDTYISLDGSDYCGSIIEYRCKVFGSGDSSVLSVEPTGKGINLCSTRTNFARNPDTNDIEAFAPNQSNHYGKIFWRSICWDGYLKGLVGLCDFSESTEDVRVRNVPESVQASIDNGDIDGIYDEITTFYRDMADIEEQRVCPAIIKPCDGFRGCVEYIIEDEDNIDGGSCPYICDADKYYAESRLIVVGPGGFARYIFSGHTAEQTSVDASNVDEFDGDIVGEGNKPIYEKSTVKTWYFDVGNIGNFAMIQDAPVLSNIAVGLVTEPIPKPGVPDNFISVSRKYGNMISLDGTIMVSTDDESKDRDSLVDINLNQISASVIMNSVTLSDQLDLSFYPAIDCCGYIRDSNNELKLVFESFGKLLTSESIATLGGGGNEIPEFHEVIEDLEFTKSDNGDGTYDVSFTWTPFDGDEEHSYSLKITRAQYPYPHYDDNIIATFDCPSSGSYVDESVPISQEHYYYIFTLMKEIEGFLQDSFDYNMLIVNLSENAIDDLPNPYNLTSSDLIVSIYLDWISSYCFDMYGEVVLLSSDYEYIYKDSSDDDSYELIGEGYSDSGTVLTPTLFLCRSLQNVEFTPEDINGFFDSVDKIFETQDELDENYEDYVPIQEQMFYYRVVVKYEISMSGGDKKYVFKESNITFNMSSGQLGDVQEVSSPVSKLSSGKLKSIFPIGEDFHSIALIGDLIVRLAKNFVPFIAKYEFNNISIRKVLDELAYSFGSTWRVTSNKKILWSKRTFGRNVWEIHDELIDDYKIDIWKHGGKEAVLVKSISSNDPYDIGSSDFEYLSGDYEDKNDLLKISAKYILPVFAETQSKRLKKFHTYERRFLTFSLVFTPFLSVCDIAITNIGMYYITESEIRGDKFIYKGVEVFDFEVEIEEAIIL